MEENMPSIIPSQTFCPLKKEVCDTNNFKYQKKNQKENLTFADFPPCDDGTLCPRVIFEWLSPKVKLLRIWHT
jgi:hypothetical protein